LVEHLIREGGAIGARVVRIGALAPLSAPGWVEAGRHLLAGLALAVDEINDTSGLHSSRFELVVRDTAASPAQAADVAEELVQQGVAALVGEYHSVSARAVAAKADALRVPYICSSAVIDALIDHPSDWVARLCPPQSKGWTEYAEHLLANGHQNIAVAAQASVYWAAGVRILVDHVASRGGIVMEVDASDEERLCTELEACGATAVLLLAGFPEPIVSMVKAIRAHERTRHILIGAPAGQPEFAEWKAALGIAGAAVPFLRYMPRALPPLGERVNASLHARLGCTPSFVALEGYDTILVLQEALKFAATRPDRQVAWSELVVSGTRGEITFSKPAGMRVWQWMWPPIQVVQEALGARGKLVVLSAGTPR
jgi:ABC-type branched-subunit amino acid transport system substrate-binding protein